jgi:hypothetical protein
MIQGMAMTNRMIHSSTICAWIQRISVGATGLELSLSMAITVVLVAMNVVQVPRLFEPVPLPLPQLGGRPHIIQPFLLELAMGLALAMACLGMP